MIQNIPLSPISSKGALLRRAALRWEKGNGKFTKTTDW